MIIQKTIRVRKRARDIYEMIFGGVVEERVFLICTQCGSRKWLAWGVDSDDRVLDDAKLFDEQHGLCKSETGRQLTLTKI